MHGHGSGKEVGVKELFIFALDISGDKGQNKKQRNKETKGNVTTVQTMSRNNTVTMPGPSLRLYCMLFHHLDKLELGVEATSARRLGTNKGKGSSFYLLKVSDFFRTPYACKP